MQVTATGNNLQERMKSLKDVMGYDPYLDSTIELLYKGKGDRFWTEHCEINEYDSWTEWAKDYDYPLQFLSDNPNYSIDRIAIQDIYYKGQGNTEDRDAIDYSRHGHTTACPKGCAQYSMEEKMEAKDHTIEECNECGTIWRVYKELGIITEL